MLQQIVIATEAHLERASLSTEDAQLLDIERLQVLLQHQLRSLVTRRELCHLLDVEEGRPACDLHSELLSIDIELLVFDDELVPLAQGATPQRPKEQLVDVLRPA